MNWIDVARQLGFKDESECVGLCELLQDYLKRSKGCHNSIFAYFANEQDAESLYVKFENELERCILAYFAFHWSKASSLIAQVCILFIKISFYLFINHKLEKLV